MGNDDCTPSFYETNETFEKYLGQTSYYLALQENILQLVSYVDPDGIVEMGSGTGATAVRLAEEFPETEVRGIDNRESVIDVSRSNAEELDLPNLTYETAEMTEYVAAAPSLPHMIVCLYSFHHIPDPRQRKVAFLEDCYTTLPDGGYLCIGEAFLTNDAPGEAARRNIRHRWADRGLEGYASTFWAALDGIDPAAIEHAQAVGEFSREHELEAGERVLDRDDEYLVSMTWLVDRAERIGFDVCIAEPVNSLGDGIVLLRT